MTQAKIYIAKKNSRKKIGVLVDLEDYFKYHRCKLRILPDGRIYFTDHGKKKFLQRDILRLTDPKKRVFFKSVNKLDLRKSNLLVRVVSEENRGRYAVQFLPDLKN
jgi:sugar lactone lactonase YvrE